jgi:hypothetical protein
MKCAVGALVLALLPGPNVISAQRAPASVSSFTGNVAGINAGDQTGFGFIVGLADRSVLLAIAWHTVRDFSGDSVTVCFLDPNRTCANGAVVYVADPIGSQPGLDLAIVRAPYPAGLVWRPDALGEVPRSGEPVWFIGRSSNWYIPNEPGRAIRRDSLRQLLAYEGLEVAEGVSGAPIVSRSGFVAMHVESDGGTGEARGVDLRAIRRRVIEGLRGRWILVSGEQCDPQSAHGRLLMGRDVDVHFDAREPEVGLAAIARLNCLGARALPHPEWGTSPWRGNAITYGSGELRAGRALQSVLAPLSRLDTRLGNAQARLELWVR